MKVANKQGSSLIQGEVESVEMAVSKKGMARMSRFLRDQIYTYKAWAVVREIVANAVDEHDKHKIARPVEVTLPTMDDPHFRVRDFAKGLSKKSVFEVFFQYFESTKDQDNDNIGGFGIGSKSPLAYAEMFFVDSYFGGQKTSYVGNVNGEASTAHCMDLQDSNETGIEVAVPVQSKDFAEFRALIAELIHFSKFNVKVVNCDDLPFPESQWKIENEVGKVGFARSRFDSGSGIYANIKGIMYAVDKTDTLNSPFYNDCVLFFDGDDEIEIHPSRERVELTQRNIVKIKNKLEAFIKTQTDNISKLAANAKTARDLFKIDADTSAFRNRQVLSQVTVALPDTIKSSSASYFSWGKDDWERTKVSDMYRYNKSDSRSFNPDGLVDNGEGYYVNKANFKQKGSIIITCENMRYDKVIAFAEKNKVASPVFVIPTSQVPDKWVLNKDYWKMEEDSVTKAEAKAVRTRMGAVVSGGGKNTGCGIPSHELLGYTTMRRSKWNAVSVGDAENKVDSGETLIVIDRDTPQLDTIERILRHTTDWKIIFAYKSHLRLWKKSGVDHKILDMDKLKALCIEKLGKVVNHEKKNGIAFNMIPEKLRSFYYANSNEIDLETVQALFPDIQPQKDKVKLSRWQQAQKKWDALSDAEREVVALAHDWASRSYPALKKQGLATAAKVFA